MVIQMPYAKVRIPIIDSEGEDEKNVRALVSIALEKLIGLDARDYFVLCSHPRPKQRKFLERFQNAGNTFAAHHRRHGAAGAYQYVFFVRHMNSDFPALVEIDFPDERFYTLFSAGSDIDALDPERVLVTFDARVSNPASYSGFACQICFPEGWATTKSPGPLDE